MRQNNFWRAVYFFSQSLFKYAEMGELDFYLWNKMCHQQEEPKLVFTASLTATVL